MLDLKMPKLGGIDVLKRIKSDERTRHIPVVVMTSSEEESDVVETYDLGVNSYVVKPLDFAQFTDVSRNAGLAYIGSRSTAPGRNESWLRRLYLTRHGRCEASWCMDSPKPGSGG